MAVMCEEEGEIKREGETQRERQRERERWAQAECWVGFPETTNTGSQADPLILRGVLLLGLLFWS